MQDDESCVRRAALTALGQLGKQAVHHIVAITGRLEDSYANVRHAAVVVVGGLGRDHTFRHTVALSARLHDDGLTA